MLLGQLLIHSPLIAVNAGGLVISLLRYQRRPKISLLAGAGFATLLLLNFVSAFSFVFTVYYFSRGMNAQSVGYVNAAIGLVLTLISAVAHGLLIAAIWKDRA